MLVRFRKFAGILCLMVYVFFYASANFFYHTHQQENSRIVHSHPFSYGSHNHTAGQILSIGTITTSAYSNSEPVCEPAFLRIFSIVLESENITWAPLTGEQKTFSLRAPPCPHRSIRF